LSNSANFDFFYTLSKVAKKIIDDTASPIAPHRSN